MVNLWNLEGKYVISLLHLSPVIPKGSRFQSLAIKEGVELALVRSAKYLI